MNIEALHKELLSKIVENAGKPTQHTFLDSYLGNSHLRYPISMPKLRSVGKAWLKSKTLTANDFFKLISSLIKGESSTEKMMAGILLDYGKGHLSAFASSYFDRWLNHLEGWAEVDSLCYGHFKVDYILEDWTDWKNVLVKLSKSKNINKRRASMVLLCKPLMQSTEKQLTVLAFHIIDRLKDEKEILITKAISWLMRSMVKLHREELKRYIKKNKSLLPAIAVRETLKKLETGKKNG